LSFLPPGLLLFFAGCVPFPFLSEVAVTEAAVAPNYRYPDIPVDSATVFDIRFTTPPFFSSLSRTVFPREEILLQFSIFFYVGAPSQLL